MVISQFHPIIGGAEKQAQLLGRALIDKGIDVDIVTGWWDMKSPRREKVGGLKVFRNFSFWGMFGIRGVRALGGLAYMISLGAHLLFHGREYDLIHVHQALYPAFVSVFMGRAILRKPVLVKYACSGITNDMNELKKFPLGSLQLAYLLKAMDCVVTVSHEGIDEFKAVGYPGSKIVHIPNGVLAPSKGKSSYDRVRRIITTARLAEQKGIDVLLRAWAHVVQQQKDVTLSVVGQGPAEGELKRLTQHLGLGGSVSYPGVTQHIDRYLKDADLFILPSRAEGLSNALLEALSYGIPSIATNIPGNAELLGMEDDDPIPEGGYAVAKNGLVFNTDDAKGLSEAILYFMGNPEEREKMGRQGRAFVQDSYSMDRIADKYIALYQRLLEERDPKVCGICGEITFNRPGIRADVMKRMCDVMAYRGPDDEGIVFIGGNRIVETGKSGPWPSNENDFEVALGHRRLSIIDLSPAGHQPMTNEDGTIWIVFNGEIYNFQELKGELETKGTPFQIKVGHRSDPPRL